MLKVTPNRFTSEDFREHLKTRSPEFRMLALSVVDRPKDWTFDKFREKYRALKRYGTNSRSKAKSRGNQQARNSWNGFIQHGIIDKKFIAK